MKRIEALNDFVIKFANVNGSGSASANELFAKSFLRMGIPVSPRNIFPSNIQGLPTWYEVRVTEKGHLGRRGGVDLMVAMNPQTWKQDVAEIDPGGYLFYDDTKPLPKSKFRDDIHVIGVPLTWREGGTSARLRLYHQSSHLGDEFLLNMQPERINLSFEAVEAMLSHELGSWRVYGGGEYLVRRDPGDFDPAVLHGGFEYRHAKPLFRLERIGWARLVAAVDAKVIQERAWGTGWSVQAGLEFGPERQGVVLGRSWSVSVDGYGGPAPFGQFYTDDVSFIGVGLHFTL